MGFESFRVELRGGPASYAQANGAVRRLPHARPDPGALPSPGSAYYTVEDGAHVIEIEVADSPVKVSCRFTLCHPPSVDAPFLALVRKLMAGLEMEAVICDDRPDDSREFAGVVSACIARRRAEWVAQFGAAQLPARTPEAYEKFILPKCVPVAG